MSNTGGYVARMDSANAMSSAPIALFKLPKAPDFPKLSDPKPLPRIVPGYDMRTLRKQLDTLHVEIRERTEQHQNVYSQNEQLWDYIRKLLEYNKTNASTMKGHINTLNNELSILHAERRDLAAKLHEAKHYRQSLSSLEEERTSVDAELHQAQQLQQEAQDLLSRAHEDNNSLENTLESQVERLSSIHSQLETLRNIQFEEAAYEKAELFFVTSEVIKRHALRRFLAGLRYNVRLKHFGVALRFVYAKYLKYKHFFGWKQFHTYSHFCRYKQQNRDARCVRLVFAQWKVHAALEKHFQHKKRRALLTLMYRKWTLFLQDRREEYRNDMLVERFQDRQYKKHLFAQWKRSCCFLEWNSSQLKMLEMRAIKYYAVRLMHAWHHEARRCRANMHVICKQAQYICLVRRPMLSWRQLCEYRFRRRRQLQKRLFRNIQKSIDQSNAQRLQLRQASRKHVHIIMRKYLYRMRRASRLAVTLRSNKKYMLFHKKRIFYSVMLQWAHRVAKMKRVSLCMRIATRHVVLRSAHKALRMWYRNTCEATRAYNLERRTILRNTFDSWCLYLPMERRERILAERVEHRYVKSLMVRSVKALRIWRSKCRKKIVLRRLYVQLKRRTYRESLYHIFSSWRCEWSKLLIWKHREAQIEAKRNFALVELRAKELEDIKQEKTILEAALEETKSSVQLISEAKQQQAQHLARVSQEIITRREEYTALVAELQECKERLAATEEERRRVSKLAEMHAAEKQRQEQEAREAQAAADAMIAALERETAALRQEALDTQYQSVKALREGEMTLESDESLLESTVTEVSVLHELVKSKQLELQEMEMQREKLAEEISLVRQKMKAVTSSDLNAEESSEKHRHMRLLEAMTEQKEARVAALREAVRERQRSVQELSIEELEWREAMDLQEMSSVPVGLHSDNYLSGLSLQQSSHATMPQRSASPLPRSVQTRMSTRSAPSAQSSGVSTREHQDLLNRATNMLSRLQQNQL